MQLYPAIDLKGGQCVRLTQGKFDEVKVYSDEPWEMAAYFESQGATYLHLVDLDGALSGRSVNFNTIKKIADKVTMPIQLGGGVRTMEDVEMLLSAGITRVIIGTKAVENPEFIGNVINRFGGDSIVAGVDAKDGMVAINGWAEISTMKATELCELMKGYGVKHIVYTDIARDGMLSGPNVESTKNLTDATGLNVIASGGVSSMEDLQQLYDAGVKGVIIGKALYEKRVHLKDGIIAFQQGE